MVVQITRQNKANKRNKFCNKNILFFVIFFAFLIKIKNKEKKNENIIETNEKYTKHSKFWTYKRRHKRRL